MSWLVVLTVAVACSLPELPRIETCRDVISTQGRMVDGTYCGSSTVNGFLPADSPDQLITCVHQHTAAITTCRNRCILNTDPLVPDGCDPDPCAQTQHDGRYCGSSTQLGFDPSQASPFVRYDCVGRATKASLYCPYGCAVAGSGSDDDCAPAPAGALR